LWHEEERTKSDDRATRPPSFATLSGIVEVVCSHVVARGRKNQIRWPGHPSVHVSARLYDYDGRGGYGWLWNLSPIQSSRFHKRCGRYLSSRRVLAFTWNLLRRASFLPTL